MKREDYPEERWKREGWDCPHHERGCDCDLAVLKGAARLARIVGQRNKKRLERSRKP